MSEACASFLSWVTVFLVWMAAGNDVRSRKIPNVLTVAGGAVGLIAHVWASGVAGLETSGFGLGVGLALMLPGYTLGSTGGGDVKLVAAVGALLGPKGVLLAFACTMIAGAAIGAVYALVARRTKGAALPFQRYGQMLRFFFTTGRPTYLPPGPEEALGQRLPFAVPIALGSTLAALWTS
ncbi:MAG: A24 family peptidase [Pseudomonadota bacterium]|nr:A24 family peptidase [Pseudomonadota bacterium]